MDDFKKALRKSLNDILENKGICLRISKEIIKSKNYAYIDFDDYDTEDENCGLEIGLKAYAMDETLLLYTLLKMFESGEADIIFSESATDKNVKYLLKLTEAILKRVE